MNPKHRSKHQKKKIFDREAAPLGFMFGIALSWIVMFGYTTLVLRPSLDLPIRSFDLALWLIPPMIFFGGALLATLILLRVREEQEYESGRM